MPTFAHATVPSAIVRPPGKSQAHCDWSLVIDCYRYASLSIATAVHTGNHNNTIEIIIINNAFIIDL